MKELYLVNISMGEWDGAYTFVHGVFDDRDRAEAEVKRVKRHYRNLARTKLPFSDEEYWRMVKTGEAKKETPLMLAYHKARAAKREGEEFKSVDIQVFRLNTPLTLIHSEEWEKQKEEA